MGCRGVVLTAASALPVFLKGRRGLLGTEPGRWRQRRLWDGPSGISCLPLMATILAGCSVWTVLTMILIILF
jgi:hypothetical protein